MNIKCDEICGYYMQNEYITHYNYWVQCNEMLQGNTVVTTKATLLLNLAHTEWI